MLRYYYLLEQSIFVSDLTSFRFVRNQLCPCTSFVQGNRECDWKNYLVVWYIFWGEAFCKECGYLFYSTLNKTCEKCGFLYNKRDDPFQKVLV